MTDTTELQVEHVAVSRLVPYARNARTHSAEQIGQIAASIETFGWTNPVLINSDNGIIAGHGRVLAAESLGWDDVPCIRLGHLTPDQERALILADNKLALNAGWDESVLAAELQALMDVGFDMPVIGFDIGELKKLFNQGTGGLTDEDDVPDTPVNPVSKRGDLWLLGNHRLICGDATCEADVKLVLDGKVPHLMVTDPPYGVNYDANWRNKAARHSAGMGNRAIGAGAVGKVMNDDRADWTEAWALFPGDVAYVWHAGSKANVVADSLISVGLEIRTQIIWGKQQFAIGRGDYHQKHEPCWYVVRKGKHGRYNGDRKQTTLWEIDKPQKSETGHSTQKPVECMRIPIENNSKPGDAVYEPFSGSGTTIIAAEQTGRSVHAIEIHPAYVDVAIRRWQEFTGKEALLESTGQTFSEITEARSMADAE